MPKGVACFQLVPESLNVLSPMNKLYTESLNVCSQNKMKEGYSQGMWGVGCNRF